ncbi:MAG: rRNA maturation RNase YbeY [Rhodobacteraceae bacterium]|nr:rRNA maturation RNase YbeY [Paracoccaceae bacterium]
MAIDIVADDPRWDAVALEDICARAEAALAARLALDPDDLEAVLLACDDARIGGLNETFRGKPAPTNVLSWPAQTLAAAAPGAPPAAPRPGPDAVIALGDLALAWETCNSEARAADKPLADHVTHLIVHGMLHLLGYDHIRTADAELMEGLEVEILGSMGLNDPYRE